MTSTKQHQRAHSRDINSLYHRLCSRGRINREEAWWDAADTFGDLCSLTATWIAGDMIVHPGYCADGVDDETEPFAATLAAINSAGYLTYDSQAAACGDDLYGCTGHAWQCCAWVTGWIADEDLLARLHDACQTSGLWMFATPTDYSTATGPKTTGRVNGSIEPLNHHGHGRPGPDDIWFPHPHALRDVAEARWVEIVDPDYLDVDDGMRLWHVLADVAAQTPPVHPRRTAP